ncbi:MAG: hypothetical protein J6Y21_10270 [Clostridia bacterium]|nr:hypothetical protein [Clostridia bacterium]
MKRKIALFTAIVMCAVFMLASVPAFAEEEKPADEKYARFIALGNDPYATFKFSASGKNTNIDPETVVWAAIRYRTESQYDSTGVEYKAQFYVNPANEPCVPVTYKFTKNWETSIIDCTATNEDTSLDSKWNSGGYTSTGEVRFDPLEPDRDSEDTSQDEVNGQVQKDDYIDVAWIAFFEKKEDAEAYTGVEDTPYCILDLSSFRNPAGAHNLKIKIQSDNGEDVPDDTDDKLFYLYDKDITVNTGWWLNPVVEEATIDVSFEIDKWFSGFNYFAYCCPNPVPMRIALLNENEDEVWSGEATCSNNEGHTVDMEKRFAPGVYTLSFIGGDVSELEYDTWFVLGSCAALNEKLEEDSVTVIGGATNDSTGPAPFVSFITCDPDPDYTPAPTKVPATATPTKAPTEAPTAAPATEAATENPAEEQTSETSKPQDNDNKNNDKPDEKKTNIWPIIGIIAAALVVICAIVVILVSLKKKKK